MFPLPQYVNILPPKGQLTKTCKYAHRNCRLLCHQSYDYCLKHILEDKSAPFRPCPFLFTVSGKKCGKPASLDQKDTRFCMEHQRRTKRVKDRTSQNPAPSQTPDTMLASLAHYVVPAESDCNTSQAINPFVDIDAAQINNRNRQILDCNSDSDSDVEAAMLDTVWRAYDQESSDAESVDSQGDDPLKHASVYTMEEVTALVKDKMIRLQALYIDQFRRLHHLLKEHRRKYLHALKKEKETLCSIHSQDKSSPKEQKLYQKLKALNHFHKYYGEEAILHKKALDRRLQVTEGTFGRTSHKGKCTFTEGGVKCGAKTLPVTKYCRKHILEDNSQVLYRACGFKRDDHVCKEPTLNVFENAVCIYHINMPHLPIVKETNVMPETKTNDDKDLEMKSKNVIDSIKQDIVNLIQEDKSQLPELSDFQTHLKMKLNETDMEDLKLEDTVREDQLKAVSETTIMSDLTGIQLNLEDPVKIDQVKAISDPPITPVKQITECASPVVQQEGVTSSDEIMKETEEVVAEPFEKVCCSEENKDKITQEELDKKELEDKPMDVGDGELNMFDMMTDVVEEVLDSEIKDQHVESMDVQVPNDNNTENG